MARFPWKMSVVPARRPFSQEAYVSFIRPVTEDSVNRLLQACQKLMSEGFRHVHLAIGSGGGNIIAGLAAYNQLRGLALTYTTYNLSRVDSVAILPYLLGERRLADEHTGFLFHGVHWTFGNSGETAAAQVTDAHASITAYEQALTAITAARAGLSPEAVSGLRTRSTLLSAEAAVRSGVATEVGGFAIPPRGRWMQV